MRWRAYCITRETCPTAHRPLRFHAWNPRHVAVADIQSYIQAQQGSDTGKPDTFTAALVMQAYCNAFRCVFILAAAGTENGTRHIPLDFLDAYPATTIGCLRELSGFERSGPSDAYSVCTWERALNTAAVCEARRGRGIARLVVRKIVEGVCPRKTIG